MGPGTSGRHGVCAECVVLRAWGARVWGPRVSRGQLERKEGDGMGRWEGGGFKKKKRKVVRKVEDRQPGRSRRGSLPAERRQ